MSKPLIGLLSKNRPVTVSENVNKNNADNPAGDQAVDYTINNE
jgi:hypothetical protein